jgi:hypothetical protein
MCDGLHFDRVKNRKTSVSMRMEPILKSRKQQEKIWYRLRIPPPPPKGHLEHHQPSECTHLRLGWTAALCTQNYINPWCWKQRYTTLTPHWHISLPEKKDFIVPNANLTVTSWEQSFWKQFQFNMCIKHTWITVKVFYYSSQYITSHIKSNTTYVMHNICNYK